MLKRSFFFVFLGLIKHTYQNTVLNVWEKSKKSKQKSKNIFLLNKLAILGFQENTMRIFISTNCFQISKCDFRILAMLRDTKGSVLFLAKTDFKDIDCNSE